MARVYILLLALFIDLALGDPPNRFHPVVLMGHWLNRGRKLAPASRRFLFGLGWITAGVALFAFPGIVARSLASRKMGLSALDKTASGAVEPHPPGPFRKVFPPLLAFTLQALLLKATFAYRNLRRRVAEVAKALADDDLPTARHLLGWHLVSRDTRELSREEVAGAAIESLAENLTDSLIAPLLAYTLGGLPAAWAYRFVNTADAMWGYRTPEFEQLGKFAARLDDGLNWLPARLAGWLLVLAAGLTGEPAHNAVRTMLTQHHLTPSPNAGWTMSAMAGALEITLTKRGVYDLAGGTRSIGVATVYQAIRLANMGMFLGIGLLCAGLIFSTLRLKKVNA